MPSLTLLLFLSLPLSVSTLGVKDMVFNDVEKKRESSEPHECSEQAC